MASYAQGRFQIKNVEKYLGNRAPMYRSSWEFMFMKMCDEHAYIQAWASEAVKIPYRNPLTGKHTIYVPDFFIAYANKGGSRKVEIIEVKPENQTLKEKLGRSKHNQAAWIVNQAKWEAARKYCKGRGYKWLILTEKELS
jgi:hypothetical protein